MALEGEGTGDGGELVMFVCAPDVFALLLVWEGVGMDAGGGCKVVFASGLCSFVGADVFVLVLGWGMGGLDRARGMFGASCMCTQLAWVVLDPKLAV